MKTRPIEGFGRYLVHEDGYVVRIEAGRPLAEMKQLVPTKRGDYWRVYILGDCGKRHQVPVHKIVLEAFVGSRPSPRHHGAHLDGNSANNALRNLAWKLPPENEADKKAHGTAPRGGKNDPTPPERIAEIHELHARGMSFTKIAVRLGMHRSSVACICQGKRRKAVAA